MKSSNTISATIISILVMLILLTLIAFMFMKQGTVDPQIGDFAKLLAGAITAKFSTVVDFWLGSSVGSRDKDLYMRHDHDDQPPSN